MPWSYLLIVFNELTQPTSHMRDTMYHTLSRSDEETFLY